MTQIIDKMNLPEVTEFIEKQLAPYDLTRLDRIKLLARPKGIGWDYTYWPEKRVAPRSRKFVHGHRLLVSVGLSSSFPFIEEIPVGSREDSSVARGWNYITESIYFADTSELLVMGAGTCAFRFLRRSKQVPGRNGGPGANLFGLEWQPLSRKRESNPHSP